MKNLQAAHQALIVRLKQSAKEPIKVAALDACLAFANYLKATQVRPDLVKPVNYALYILTRVYETERQGTKPGRIARPSAITLALATAAAAITIIKQTSVCSIPESTDYVAKISGIAKLDLKNFRDSVHRGKTTKTARDEYWDQVKKLRSADLVEEIQNAGALYRLWKKNVPNPRF
jgi:hypothetical protein